MVVCAARLEGKLRDELERMARKQKDYSIAELNRAIGERAETLGLTRPSYARVRQVVNGARARIEPPSWGELLLDVDLRKRPPEALIDKLAGTWPMDEQSGIGPRR